MSELKAVHAFDVYEAYTKTGDDDAAQVYLKSEADKVIAEKDAEIARLKAIRKVHVEAFESMEAGLLQDEESIRHQKRKRCINNAWWCRKLIKECALSAYTHRGWTIERHFDNKAELYRKWRKRWLAIAEKFKEEVK